jgi:hypothetical protein
MDFSALGITKEDLQKQIIDKAVSELLGGEVDFDALFREAIDTRAREIVEQATNSIAKEVIEPKVVGLIEGLTFQETNSWGEPKKPAKTWREMLIERAENWLSEKVNYNGKAKGEEWGWSWSPNTTRIAYMVDKHLQYEIKSAMEKALAEVNSQIAGGIAGAVKTSLAQVLTKLKVEVKA